ncbi:MAG: hypothetical protein LBR49_01615 [Tannerella sp.]|nr:hypothetical protein [Tannerella sp.]
MNKRGYIIYHLIGICLLLAGAVSCVSEYDVTPKTEPESEEKVVIRLPFQTKGTYQEESDIFKARIIVFKADGTFVLTDTIPENPTGYVTPTFVDTVPAGHLNIYLIANELPTWNLNTVTTEAQLKAVLYSEYYPSPGWPEADATHHVPMFGEYKNVLVDAVGNETPILWRPGGDNSATVERIFAKVTFILTCQFSDQLNGGVPIELSDISFKRMPNYSSLVATRYTGSFPLGFHNKDAIGGKGISSAYSENATGFRDSVTFYVPEYLVNDTSLFSYISLTANVTGATALSKTYRVIMGEGWDKAIGSSAYFLTSAHQHKFMRGDTVDRYGNERTVLDLDIRRNTHYIFYATLKNFDLTGDEDVEIYLKVADWTEKPLSPWDVGEKSLTLSRSVFSGVGAGFEGVVYVDTDSPDGWTATVASGSIVLIDNAGATTTYTNEPSGQLRFRANGNGEINVVVGTVTKKIKITI